MVRNDSPIYDETIAATGIDPSRRVDEPRTEVQVARPKPPLRKRK